MACTAPVAAPRSRLQAFCKFACNNGWRGSLTSTFGSWGASSWCVVGSPSRWADRSRVWRSRCWRPTEGQSSRRTDCATSCGADNPPADPPGVLQSHLSRLRRILRPEAEILARPPGYVLQIPDEAIDAGRFEQLCRRAGASSDPTTDGRRCWKRALMCWRGSAFEEFAEHDWARFEAMRLDELHIVAQEELLEARLALGGHVALIGELEALVARASLAGAILAAADRGAVSQRPIRGGASTSGGVPAASCGRNSGSIPRRPCGSSKPCPQRGPHAPSAARGVTAAHRCGGFRPSRPGWSVGTRSSSCSRTGCEAIDWSR